jgi:DNA mismatch repair protein MutL
MTSKIIRLSEDTINKVAAGEVVENSASVIKELIENSIDAGSTKIEIETKAGGHQLIRIVDNGSGMNSEEALLSLERHTTSKIRTVEDLNFLSTMGFRGEALPSIAAVSIMTLMTSMRSEEGILIEVEGGLLKNQMPWPRSRGTTIEVRSLFFNVPARKKFQKTVGADTSDIHKILTFIALSNPKLCLKWIHDTKIIMDLYEESLEERVYNLLGKKEELQLLPITLEDSVINIGGFIGSPSHHRSNRLGQYLTINKRVVSSNLISQAVQSGYGPRLPSHRYPFFVLQLTLSMNDLDVNVHPQKKEVRFSQEEVIRNKIFEAIEKGLQKGKPLFSSPPSSPSHLGPSKLYQNNLSSPLYVAESYNEYLTNNARILKKENNQVQLPLDSLQILGVYENFALIESRFLNISLSDEGLAYVHLERAAKRVSYENIIKEGSLQSISSQTLLFPITFTVSAIESAYIATHLDLFSELGFSIRSFGKNVFAIDSIPSFLQPSLASSVIIDLIPDQEAGKLALKAEDTLQNRVLRLLRFMKKETHTDVQAVRLIKELNCSKEPLYCPFGQRIVSVITQDELLKRFN